MSNYFFGRQKSKRRERTIFSDSPSIICPKGLVRLSKAKPIQQLDMTSWTYSRMEEKVKSHLNNTMLCPISSNPFYIVSYYIKWVTTSWTHSMY